MKFNSKIDWLYTSFIVLIGITGILISDIFFVLGFWYISLVVVLIFVFLFYIVFTTNMTFLEDKLQIRVGFFLKNIEYADIKEVKIAKNIISSRATSVKRIGIRTKEKSGRYNYTYISPENQEEFLNELKKHVNSKVIFTK